MKSLRFYLMLLAFLQYSAFTQTNFKQGKLVSSHGDTLNGFINCREWNYNPTRFSFKNKLDDDSVQKRDLTNTNSFMVDGIGEYDRFVASVSLDNVDLASLSQNMDTSHFTQPVFLKLIIRGRFVSLYSYSDEVKTRYYTLETNSNNPVELEYKLYSPNNNVITYKKYIGQLMILAKKYNGQSKELEHKISDASYISRDLISIILDINGQKKEDIKQYGQIKLRMVFFVGAGLTRSYLTFAGNDPLDHALSDPLANISKKPVAYKPSFTLGITLTNKPDARSALHEALSISYLNYKAQCMNNYPDLYYTETRTVFLEMYTISLQTSFSYKLYNAKDLKILIGSGFFINAAKYQTNYLDIKDVGPNHGNGNTQYQDFYMMKNFWVSIPITAGIILFRHYEISMAWFIPSNLNRLVSDVEKLHDSQITIKYNFGKNQ